VWLNIAIGLFVVTLWSIGVGLVLDEGGAEFNLLLLKRTAVGAAIFGGVLGLFFGLRILVRMAFSRIDLMQRDDRWLGLDMSIGLFAAILWSGGAALILSDNGAEFTLARFVELTLLGTVSIGIVFALFFGLRALAQAGLRRIKSA
jgi:hypothetical protein